MELAVLPDSKSGAFGRVGSTPTLVTMKRFEINWSNGTKSYFNGRDLIDALRRSGYDPYYTMPCINYYQDLGCCC